MTDREKLIELILNITDAEAELLCSELGIKKKSTPYRRVVYSIKHNATGREYIGKTKNLETRIYQHKQALKRGQHIVEDMQRDYDEYGDDFTVSTLEIITTFEDNKREYELIRSHESHIRGKGYNYRDSCFRKWLRNALNGETT